MYTAFCEGFKILCLLLSIEIKSVISFTAMNNEQRLLMLILSQSNMNEYGDEVVSNPTTAEGWKEIAASYSSQWNFHHELGALDGKHIRIRCPANGGSQFCNYKRYHSTGPRSAVGNVSDYRCVSDCSSIPAQSHTFVEFDHEIISTVILLPSTDSFKKGCCQLQAKVCAQITG